MLAAALQEWRRGNAHPYKEQVIQDLYDPIGHPGLAATARESWRFHDATGLPGPALAGLRAAGLPKAACSLRHPGCAHRWPPATAAIMQGGIHDRPNGS